MQRFSKHPCSFKFLQGACFSVLFFIILTARSQEIQNGSTFYIPSGIEVHTEGSLINTGFFQNNGSFFLAGDWKNESIYQGLGIVSFEGGDQLISNNRQSITHLIINGGGIKSIEGKIFIDGQVDFNDGVLSVSDRDTVVMTETCVATGGSESSYADGALTSRGNSYKFFPIGKNGKYHPVELLNIIGISPVLELEVFENLVEIKTDTALTVFHDIYWTRKTIAGSFEKSPVTLGYTIPLAVDLSRVVLVQGNTLSDVFDVVDKVSVQSANGTDLVSSVDPLTGQIIAIGKLASDLPKSYYLSTTLSPNANNPENRAVKVFGDNFTPAEFYFQVFNRWGLSVYETQSLDHMTTVGWDGRQHGSVLPTGVYPYSIKYVDTLGKSNQQKGIITIIY
jgi:CHU_C Type IX secretion signal domain